jgi:methionine-rich copper-binding protein CopC
MVVTPRSGVRRYVLAGALLVLAAFAASSAQGHAVVTRTTLEEKAIPANTATPVTLYFNSRIEPAFTRVILVDEARKEHTLEVTPGEKGDTVMVHLPALAPGTYALRYKVLAIDGHVTEGVLRFRVRPAE